MYELEIETRHNTKRIWKPKKARYSDWVHRFAIQVMDGAANWHFIGHCFSYADAEDAVEKINSAIEEEDVFVYVDIS